MPTRDAVLRARGLRRNMTGVELILWQRLRRRRVDGYRFRRQAPIGPYFADFVCLAARLVVEIDGPSHEWRLEADGRRDTWFASKGYRVLRFAADEVLRETDWVVDVIWWALHGAPPSRLRRATSPPSGEESHGGAYPPSGEES